MVCSYMLSNDCLGFRGLGNVQIASIWVYHEIFPCTLAEFFGFEKSLVTTRPAQPTSISTRIGILISNHRNHPERTPKVKNPQRKKASCQCSLHVIMGGCLCLSPVEASLSSIWCAMSIACVFQRVVSPQTFASRPVQ